MAQDDGRKDNQSDDADELRAKFPDAPRARELPDAPKLNVELPPRPSQTRGAGRVEPGSYSKLALAMTAATTFIMPVLVLSIGGYYLDQKLKHQVSWLAMIGLIVGLITGVTALLRVVAKLAE